MVWSRHLGTASIDHAAPPDAAAFVVPTGRLWVVRHIGLQVPAGGVLVWAGPDWSSAPSLEADNASGTRSRGFGLEVFVVLEQDQSAGIGWGVPPSAGTGFAQIDGYDLPYP